MLTGQLYRQVRDRFRRARLETPDLDAKLLVAAALGLQVSEVVLKEEERVAIGDSKRANTYADKRLGGMPVGRILGEREFYGRKFRLNDATLEPRPDTETLVDAILQRIQPDESCLICDVGTGSGAVAVSVLAERPACRMIAVDLAESALRCAWDNAGYHKVEDRFHPLCADYLSALKSAGDACEGGVIDWVVSNPPYIRSSILSELSREVSQYDPKLALDGGETGLDAYESIVSDAKCLLPSGGNIAFEIGYDQAGEVKKQLRHHGFGAIEIIKDLAGNDRVAVARKTQTQ